MADFEKTLAESTTRGSNSIPGCVLAAVDQNGQYAIVPAILVMLLET